MLNTKPVRKNDIKTEVLDVVAEERILDTIGIKTDKMDNNINNFKIDNVLNDNNVVEKAIAETNVTQANNPQPEVKHVPIPIASLPQYVPQHQQTMIAPAPQQSAVASQPSFAPNVMSSYSVTYDDEKNSYTITYNGNIESIFTHKDIIDALNDANNANYVIRQYFFIISHNDNTGMNEINFVNSPVTTNIEIMIKIQNYLYELLNSSTDNAETFDKILFLYYQLIIYLFRNYARYESYPKIQKFYSTLSFRFSTLVLKQVVELGKVNAEMEMKIKQIDDVKDELMLLASGILPQQSDATNRTQTTDATQYTTENTDKTAETVTTNKTLSELLSEASENPADDGLTGFVDNDATNSLITPATADGLTGFTDKNEFTSSQQLINKHGITNSNGQTVTNFDSIWNDDVSNPVSISNLPKMATVVKPAEITVETKGGKGKTTAKGKQQKEKPPPKPRGRPAKNKQNDAEGGSKANNTASGGGIVMGSKLSSSSTTSSTTSSTSASSSYTSNSDDDVSSSSNDLSPSYNEFSAKNNSRKIHVKL